MFAKKNIKKGEIVVIVGGYVFTFAEEMTFPRTLHDLALQISPKFVIGIRSEDQFQEIVENINHSCSPNLGVKGQIFFVAMRDIKRNEQVTFDYCMVLSKAKGVKGTYKFKCGCGASNCRKVITWNDWKKSELQKKYKGYFSWYLEEKIKDMNKKSRT